MSIDHSKIYERLLAIRFEIDPKPIPDPQYINSKIGECHRFIAEIERFAIGANQELSAVQKLLNDVTALYENAKENILSTDPNVKSLPSIKDREAKVNSLLKKELQDIRENQNAVSACTNLLRAINLKQRNLNRANTDIKMQLRMMEAQVKLGTPMAGDAATASLMAELAKGISSDEVLEPSETSATLTQVEDPTAPINMSSVLQDSIPGIVGPDADPDEEDDRFSLVDPTAEIEEPGEEAVREAETDPQEVDLDQVIDGKPTQAVPNPDKTPTQEPATSTQKGGATPQEPQSAERPATTPKAGQQKVEGIDLDSLLSQFN